MNTKGASNQIESTCEVSAFPVCDIKFSTILDTILNRKSVMIHQTENLMFIVIYLESDSACFLVQIQGHLTKIHDRCVVLVFEERIMVH